MRDVPAKLVEIAQRPTMMLGLVSVLAAAASAWAAPPWTRPAGSARSRFGPARALERWPAAAVESVRRTSVRAVAAGGRLVLAWMGFRGGLYITRLAEVAGGAVGAPQTLNAPGLDVELRDLAAAASGRAVAALQVSDPHGARSAIFASERPVGGTAFGALVRVSDGSRPVGSARVALDPAGTRAVAIWLEGRTPTVRAATLP